MKKIILLNILFIIIASVSGCGSRTVFQNTPYENPNAAEGFGDNSAFWTSDTHAIWNGLQRISTARLMIMQHSTTNPNITAYLQLALISKRYSTNTANLIKELLAWRTRYPTHPANALFPDNQTLNQLLTAASPHHVALLLPLHDAYGNAGQSIRDGFINAYYAGRAEGSKQNISFFDTSKSDDVIALYQQAISEGADYVIGPLLKENVQKLISHGSFPAPTLALNYTNIYFGSLPNNFYEFGLLPEDEAQQIAERAREAGLSRAIVIAPNNAWGDRLVSTFKSTWKSLGGKVEDTWYFDPSSTTFNEDTAKLLKVDTTLDKELMKKNPDKQTLEQQRRQDFDVIFLFAQPKSAREIVPLLRFYYASNIPIYATSAIYSGKPSPEKDVDLNGVILCDTPLSLQYAHHATNGEPSDRLYAVGQDAYLLGLELPRLIQIPEFPIYGKTGALTLSPQHQIHRRLPCSTITNGSP